MRKILISQPISNLKEEGFTDVERAVNVIQAHVDGGDYKQFLVVYEIAYTKDGVDVSHLFKNKSSYNWIINNNEKIMQRDENFEPILDEEGHPTLVPAFDYVMGIFDSMDAISYQVLRMYILENDADGKWDLD